MIDQKVAKMGKQTQLTFLEQSLSAKLKIVIWWKK